MKSLIELQTAGCVACGSSENVGSERVEANSRDKERSMKRKLIGACSRKKRGDKEYIERALGRLVRPEARFSVRGATRTELVFAPHISHHAIDFTHRSVCAIFRSGFFERGTHRQYHRMPFFRRSFQSHRGVYSSFLSFYASRRFAEAAGCYIGVIAPAYGLVS